MFKKSFNAPTTFGRHQSQNSTDLRSLQMLKMNESEERSYLQAVQRQAELLHTERKFTISPGNALTNPTTSGAPWSEAMQSSLGMASALLMSSRGCSGPH